MACLKKLDYAKILIEMDCLDDINDYIKIRFENRLYKVKVMDI